MSEAPACQETYLPRLTARSRRLTIRGVPYHVREWGEDDRPLLFMLHGARDTSASFQFLIDALPGEWRVVAPDWRGHGRSGWTPGSYWHGEFASDLQVLLDLYAPGQPITLVGHSMGGNVASIFAGLRPERVQRLVLLDALGDLLNRLPVRPDEILRLVLDTQANGRAEHVYGAPDALAPRLRRRNPRLAADRAMFLARAMARETADGRFGWPFDPGFHRSFPNVHTDEDWGVIWRGISAPVLCLTSTDHRPASPTSHPEALRSRAAHFRDITVEPVVDTGHNLHLDAPEAVALRLAAFCAGSAAEPRRAGLEDRQ